MSATYADALAALYPYNSWSMTDDLNYVTLVWNSTVVPKPTQQELDDERIILDNNAPFQACKQEASRRLYATDWTTIADVADPAKSDPYLINQAAFISYRSDVRKLAVNPVANPIWPTEPTAVWSA